MTNSKSNYPHEADPDIFREALAYSEADKGFTSTLIEKDYYCSLITRKEPAIRDFFDVVYAVRKRGLNTQDPEFLSMVKAKIDVPGNQSMKLSEERKQELNRQLEGQQKPVLRPSDFDGFDLNEAFELVHNIADALSL